MNRHVALAAQFGIGAVTLRRMITVVHRSRRGVALAAVYPAAIRVWLPNEKHHLERRFSGAYHDYRRRVRRWIGRHPSGQELRHG